MMREVMPLRSPTSQAPKKRKPTYLVRKEEGQAVKDEILQLEATMAVLKTRGMPAGSALSADPGLQQAQSKSKVLTNAVQQQQLGIASAQALLLECTRTQFSNPLCTHIHLKKDLGERRAKLLAIRDEKLKNAYDYVVARTSQVPDGQGQESTGLFETDRGDVCILGSTVIPFPGVRSLRQVFDALWFYLTNMEISISELLGHITVREDYDMIDGSAYNSRILSSTDHGVTTETNAVVFGQLFEKDDARFGDEPCAIVASDCVDEDDAFPYKSSEFVRKDISGAVVLTVSRQKEGESGEDDEVVVVMRRAGYLRIHRAEFAIPPLAQQELAAGIADWGKVMVKAMREILCARP